MKKLLVSLLFTLFPVLVFAENGALSFTPPLSDVSVVFLGNIFGIVDGVLNGTGSQIMGTIFGVFNAAVLALGGIVIMYTLIVSTLNTAHEGQMLGQKWSSIWVPVRATLGLALLIPKASGYCLMQVFVMWVVVQGVGAADKVWSAALDYLNRGGVIVQQQIDPITSIMGGGSTIANGAATILYGQVCMAGLQQALTLQRQSYINLKNQKMGPCYGTISPDMNSFCETPVPDFLSSVNAVTFQTDQQATAPGSEKFTMNMPNFPSGTYSALNGICGTITWDALDTSSLNNINSLNSSNLETAKLSRVIAIQQMYSMLSSIAQVMVNNDPQLSPDNTSSDSPSTVASVPTTPTATDQFGVPYSSTGSVCSGNQVLGDVDANCVSWGSDAGNSTAPLFNGNEFQGAIAAYNAVMLPTLNLLNESKNTDTANKQRAFISQASTQGWMMAGSYFFSLASINTANTTTAVAAGTAVSSMGCSGSNCPVPITDQNSGIGGSTFNIQTLTNAFNDKNCSGILCTWFNKSPDRVNQVISLINGSPSATQTPLSIPTSPMSGPLELNPVTGAGASTAYGFVNNSLMVVLPGQPGTAPPKFVMRLVPSVGTPSLQLPTLDYSCGKVSIIGFSFCLIQDVALAVYNDVFVPVFNYFLNLVTSIINTIVMAFMALPLAGMAQIFQYGLSYITQPNVNPIVGLASMGVNYINFVADLWIYLTGITIMTSFLGPFGVVIFAILAMAMPLLMAWTGVMMAIGFITAYFIPFLPYMIFTFGSIAWLMAVIEAMVAAPIVALGITHPEGEGPFGKGEQAIMILMNVFLRPALMIIGYIAGIILSYVGIWVINAGFSNVLPFIQGDGDSSKLTDLFSAMDTSFKGQTPSLDSAPTQLTTGYTGWAAVYGFFFSILVYTTMYMTVVQKSFTLITSLPDKVLRWIGGQQETIGSDAMQWSEDSKQKIDSASKENIKAQGQIGEKLGAYAAKGVKEIGGGESGPDLEFKTGDLPK